VLKHVYGMPLGQHSQNELRSMDDGDERLGFFINMFAMADKYEFPSVRPVIVSMMDTVIMDVELDRRGFQLLRTQIPDLPEHIARVCGPDAPRLADPAMRTYLFEWVVYNIGMVGEDPEFKVKLEDESLLNAELTTMLLLKSSERIRELNDSRETSDDNPGLDFLDDDYD
jgi:hypothetical protein